MLEATRSGKLSRRVGAGVPFTHTYVDNTAWCHLKAAAALLRPASAAAAGGQAFFCTDDTPIVSWFDFYEPLVRAKLGGDCGYPSAGGAATPAALALAAAYVLEFFCWLLGLFGIHPRPNLTPISMRAITTQQTFDGSKAKRLLGRVPSPDSKRRPPAARPDARRWWRWTGCFRLGVICLAQFSVVQVLPAGVARHRDGAHSEVGTGLPTCGGVGGRAAQEGGGGGGPEVSGACFLGKKTFKKNLAKTLSLRRAHTRFLHKWCRVGSLTFRLRGH